MVLCGRAHVRGSRPSTARELRRKKNEKLASAGKRETGRSGSRLAHAIFRPFFVLHGIRIADVSQHVDKVFLDAALPPG